MAVTATRLTRYICAATITVLFYEWFACFEEECRYIHKAPWTSVKVAYLLCRYYPLIFFPVYTWSIVGEHTLATCLQVTKPIHITMALFMLIAQAVFIIRTYAFTGRNKFTLAFLVGCWISLCTTLLWILVTKYSVINESIFKLDGTFACALQSHNVSPKYGFNGQLDRVRSLRPLGMFIFATFLFDSVMTLLVFTHAIRRRTLALPLGKAFIAQGLMAYVMLSALDLSITIVFLLPYRENDGVVIMRPDTGCIIACRLILMLRRRVDPTADTQVRRQSEIVRDAIGRIEAMGGAVYKDHTQTIQHWD